MATGGLMGRGNGITSSQVTAELIGRDNRITRPQDHRRDDVSGDGHVCADRLCVLSRADSSFTY